MNVKPITIHHNGHVGTIVWCDQTRMWHGKIEGTDLEFSNGHYSDVVDSYRTIVDQYLANQPAASQP